MATSWLKLTQVILSLVNEYLQDSTMAVFKVLIFKAFKKLLF